MVKALTASPLHGGYLVQKSAPRLALRLVDGVLRLARPVIAPRATAANLSEIDSPRILLGIGGHLGDAVIASGAIGLVRRAVPAARIGVVTGTWSHTVLRGHPDVEWMHTLDHWKVNRSGEPLVTRWNRYRQSLRRALRELRGVGYEAAIDLYPYYPNMAELFWRARIPQRAGWTSGGFGALYTQAMAWVDADQHVLEKHRAIISAIVPAAAHDGQLRYELPPITAETERRTTALLAERNVHETFVILHLGAGQRQKEWPLANWQAFARRLVDDGRMVVLTGQGHDAARSAAAVLRAAPGTVNLVDALAWDELVCLIEWATALYAADTVAPHVAAAVDTPAVVLWAGINNPAHWRPLGTQCRILTNPVACAPCYQRNGCDSMACIRGVTVDMLYDVAFHHALP